jgi:tetratricopeptide (TPR) repeat protein
VRRGAAVTVVLSLSSSAAAYGPAPNAELTSPARIQALAAAVTRDDCAEVIRLGAPIADAGARAGLPADAEAEIQEVVASCEWRAGTTDAAYRHALRGTTLDEASEWLWRSRLALELTAKRYEDAVATIEAMSRGRGAALNSIDLGWMHLLNRELRDSHKTPARKRLLAVLASDAYAPDQAYGPLESYRLEYARLLAEEGDKAAAAAQVRRLQSRHGISGALFDSRLREWVDPGVDLRSAAETALARYKEAAALYPDRLGPLVMAASELRSLGRPQEAVALLDVARGRIDDPAGFEDREEQLNWWWDELGRTYHQLGRYEEMVDAFRKGAAIAESGKNVSQVINLAEAQNSFGRGEDALKTLAVFSDPERSTSPYGAMEMRFARGCAYAVAGRPSEAAADLAFARAHEKDHPEALADLLLCLGDMDGAAAAFIRRLEDPERRADALLQLSDYDAPPVARPPHPVESRLPALKQRPDVQAAIAKAGGIRRIRLQRGEL